MKLDEISAGRLEWKAFLAHFWPQFHEAVSAAMKVPIEQVTTCVTVPEAPLSACRSYIFPSTTFVKQLIRFSREGGPNAGRKICEATRSWRQTMPQVRQLVCERIMPPKFAAFVAILL